MPVSRDAGGDALPALIPVALTRNVASGRSRRPPRRPIGSPPERPPTREERSIPGQTTTLAANLAAVKGAITAAAQRAGRDPEGVRLVAVTKSVDADIIAELVRLGARSVGENRIQVAAPKISRVPGDPEWHLIGHLQANKCRRAVELFPWIHSVDSESLFDRVERVSTELGRRPRVLLQVNVSGEPSKHGFDEDELLRFLRERPPRNLVPVGLMTMAPLLDDPEQSRPFFRRLRELAGEIVEQHLVDPRPFRELSMGMTNDFEVAVEEGATLVRVGRALFHGCSDPSP